MQKQKTEIGNPRKTLGGCKARLNDNNAGCNCIAVIVITQKTNL
jgi:hypothetical protein